MRRWLLRFLRRRGLITNHAPIVRHIEKALHVHGGLSRSQAKRATSAVMLALDELGIEYRGPRAHTRKESR